MSAKDRRKKAALRENRKARVLAERQYWAAALGIPVEQLRETIVDMRGVDVQSLLERAAVMGSATLDVMNGDDRHRSAATESRVDPAAPTASTMGAL